MSAVCFTRPPGTAAQDSGRSSRTLIPAVHRDRGYPLNRSVIPRAANCGSARRQGDCAFPQPIDHGRQRPGFTWNHRRRNKQPNMSRHNLAGQGPDTHRIRGRSACVRQARDVLTARRSRVYTHVSPAFSTSGSTVMYATDATVRLWVTATGTRMEHGPGPSEVDNRRDIHT